MWCITKGTVVAAHNSDLLSHNSIYQPGSKRRIYYPLLQTLKRCRSNQDFDLDPDLGSIDKCAPY